MKNLFSRLALALSLCSAPCGHAAITQLNYWRLGESDSGAASGGLATNTVDSVGTDNLTVNGSARYSSSVSSTAGTATGSALCLNSTNGVSYASGPVPTTVNNNFGVEGWFFPKTNSNQLLFYNGDPGTSGWGLGMSLGLYQILYGGVLFYTTTATITTNAWVHLALVESNGTATLYTNGMAASSVVVTPNPPNGSLAVGANVGGGNCFTGMIDEVRVFSFVTNQFSTNDLLFHAGPPTATISAASNITATSATLNANVNADGNTTTSYFSYGIGVYGTFTANQNEAASKSSVAVSNTVSGLTPATQYQYLIVVTNNAGGNQSIGVNFTTLAAAPTTVATQPATGLSNGVATLNGTVNSGGVATTAWFEWGLAANDYTFTTTPVAVSGATPVAISNLVSGLTPGVIYHGRVVATNVNGVARGNDVLFGSPALVLNGSAIVTNECHVAYTDAGATAVDAPFAIAAGGNHGLVLRADGTVVAWGLNTSGQTNVPTNAINIVKIAAGGSNSLALRSDSTVIGWGDNTYGQTNIPASVSNVMAIAEGGNHGLALRSDGTVVGWGLNTSGQTNVPSSATNVVAVAAGSSHSLVLRTDGTVIGWGLNTSGQTNIPAIVTNVVAIAAGGSNSLALRTNGTVVGWGLNTSGQTNIPASATNVVAIAVGSSHCLALRANGTVIGWGLNTSGQTNVPANATNVVAIAAGGFYSLALRADGAVIGWGTNAHGEIIAPTNVNALPVATGNVDTSSIGSYTQTYTSTNWLGGIATVTRTVIVADTAPPVITINGPNPLTNAVNIPFVDPGATAQDACSGSQTVTATNNITLNLAGTYFVTYTAADNFGNLATNTRTVVLIPVLMVTTLPATAISNTVATLNATVNPGGAATTAWFEWGPAANDYTFTTAPIAVSVAAPVAVSNLVSGLTPGVIYHGRVVATNVNGVARGNDVLFGSPVLFLNGSAIVSNECHVAYADAGATAIDSPFAIAAGGNHGLVLRADGTVVGWGLNTSGQTNVPTSAINIVKIAAGGSNSLALRSDSTVIGWGDNTYGQTNIPASVSNVMAIAEGGNHGLALRSDGTVVGWGLNTSGQTNVPTNATSIVKITAGGSNSLALRSDSTVVGWGDNTYGQTNIPPGTSNVVAIAAGGNHGLALRSDGTVVGWGLNTSGQTNIPVNATNVVDIAAGVSHSLALRADGTVICWGLDTSGQTDVPANATNVVAIAAGGFYSLALRADGTVIDWGANNNGETLVPTNLTALAVVPGSVDTSSTGNFTQTYTSTNWLGGLGTIIRTVVIIDTTPPVITLIGNNPLTNAVNNPFVDPGATAQDACSGSQTVTATNNVDTSTLGSYTVIYTAQDSFGNLATNTRTVVVRAPVNSVVTGAGDIGAGSLRQAIADALPGDSISFGTNLSGQKIVLTGQLVLTKNVTIDASALAGGLQLAGNHNTRIIQVQSGVTVVLNGLTITNGLSVSQGGGIFNAGFLTMNRCVVAQNSVIGNPGGNGADATCSSGPGTGGNGVNGSGGGVYNGGTLALNLCTFVANSVIGGNGGTGGKGIAGVFCGYARSGNGGDGGSALGGGIYNAGALTVSQCTLVSNFTSGGIGGAFGVNGGDGTGSSGNTGTGGGGGICNFNSLTINQCTLSSNSAQTYGGGIYNIGATPAVSNSIVAANSAGSAGADVYGGATFGGSNIVQSVASGTYLGTRITNAPKLAPLGNYGGPTPTMPPLIGSPAIDAATNTTFTNDQRGFPRPSGPAPDVGSVEVQQLIVLTLPATGLVGNAATVNATLNPGGSATTAYFQYGTTTNYGNVTANILLPATNATLAMSNLISSLQPGTLYHFAAVASNSFVTTVGNDLTVTTPTLLPPVTLAASGVSNSVATLNATVNPNTVPTTAWFDYGLQPNIYSQHTAPTAVGSGTIAIFFSTNVGALASGVIYHFRVTASNAFGVAHGRDLRFGAPSVLVNGLTSTTTECHAGYTDAGVTTSEALLAIAAGGSNTLALRADGTVVEWGSNASGQTNVPTSATNVTAIAAGANHGLALQGQGSVIAWGLNTSGQTNVPATATNVIAIEAGASHNLALRADGTVMGWGLNTSGQTNIPASATNGVAIAAGGSHSLALRADGTVVGWGLNTSGQTNIPANATNVVAIEAGASNSLALRSDGTVVGWGNNTFGQTNIPVNATNVVAIAAGDNHILALRSDGTVVAWGLNTSGQTNAPASATNVVAIAAGSSHSLALRADGTVVGWGDNSVAQATIPTNVNGVPVIPVGVSGNVDNSSPGTYVLTYAATNALGGVTTTTRTVVVVDTTPPVLTVLGNSLVILTNAANLPFVDPGATAMDACAGALPVTAVGNVNGNLPGLYTINYSSTDSFGNTGTNSRTVVVAMLALVPGDQNGDGIISQSELDQVYAHYLINSPWLYITNVAGLGGTNVTFALSNSVAGNYSVQYSTNLTDWYYLGPATPRYLFADTNAPAVPQRYYRLVYP